MSKMLRVALVLSVLALGCNEEKGGGAAPEAKPTGAPAAAADQPTAAPAAAGETPCDAVVAKLASYDPSSGDAEKKLWTKMCADMPEKMRACLVASTTKEERDACGKDEKLIK